MAFAAFVIMVLIAETTGSYRQIQQCQNISIQVVVNVGLAVVTKKVVAE
jgi:hypothetical protein